MESSIEIIKRKLILYATAMDTRNWDLVDDIFHEDATAFYGDDNFSFEPQSREEILIMCKSSLGGCGWTPPLDSRGCLTRMEAASESPLPKA